MFRSKFVVTRPSIGKTLVVISIFGLALFTTASGHIGGRTLSKHEEPRSVSSAPDKTGQRLEVEEVTITADGFDPQQIVRPAGPFFLSVTNRSGVDSLNIQLETEQHGKLREKSLPLETPYWREKFSPPTGRYVITEVNHPEWTFSLIIQ